MFRTVGFVPIISGLVAEMGSPFPAYIYGYMWLERNSYNQFSESFETLPERLGISRSTIRKWAGWLCEHGYLIDLTPGELSKPHTYQLTGKVSVNIIVTATMWVTKNSGGVVEPQQGGVVEPQQPRGSSLDNHDHDMMHDHEDKYTDPIKITWVDMGFDLRGLPKMLKVWNGHLAGLLFCLRSWHAAMSDGSVPDDWGYGLIYKKIADGDMPPEKPRTIGDDVRDLMELQKKLNGDSEAAQDNDRDDVSPNDQDDDQDQEEAA